MYRVKNTFPFPLPLTVGDVVDLSECADRALLIAHGYVEEVDLPETGAGELFIIDEADNVPNDLFDKLDELQIGIDAEKPEAGAGDTRSLPETAPQPSAKKKQSAKKSKVETK